MCSALICARGRFDPLCASKLLAKAVLTPFVQFLSKIRYIGIIEVRAQAYLISRTFHCVVRHAKHQGTVLAVDVKTCRLVRTLSSHLDSCSLEIQRDLYVLRFKFKPYYVYISASHNLCSFQRIIIR